MSLSSTIYLYRYIPTLVIEEALLQFHVHMQLSTCSMRDMGAVSAVVDTKQVVVSFLPQPITSPPGAEFRLTGWGGGLSHNFLVSSRDFLYKEAVISTSLGNKLLSDF